MANQQNHGLVENQEYEVGGRKATFIGAKPSSHPAFRDVTEFSFIYRGDGHTEPDMGKTGLIERIRIPEPYLVVEGNKVRSRRGYNIDDVHEEDREFSDLAKILGMPMPAQASR